MSICPWVTHQSIYAHWWIGEGTSICFKRMTKRDKGREMAFSVDKFDHFYILLVSGRKIIDIASSFQSISIGLSCFLNPFLPLYLNLTFLLANVSHSQVSFIIKSKHFPFKLQIAAFPKAYWWFKGEPNFPHKIFYTLKIPLRTACYMCVRLILSPSHAD